MLPEEKEFADEAALRRLIAARLRQPAAEELRVLASSAIARHGGRVGVRAVLAYGSTLRDASFSETLADLYVLTADFAQVSDSALARLGCRLVPPNVYYLSAAHGEETLRAKYAVLPLAQFARRMQADVDNPYFWARFAQPSRLVWSADEAAAKAVEEAVLDAVFTALTTAAMLTPHRARADWRKLWRGLLAATYRTELRVESPARAESIVAADEEWFRETVRGMFGMTEDIVFPAWLEEMRGKLNWRRVVWQGKLLTLLRLGKAAFTFSGGADYIAFKIERHTGEHFELTEWQRRHPLLTGIMMLPRLLRRGLVK